MRLARLWVRQFRNFEELDVELPEPGVVLIGDNGQGKTNFLEAIYYLVLFRSLRGALDRHLVRFGQDGFFVAGQWRGEPVAGQSGSPEPNRGAEPSARRLSAGYQVASGRKKVALDGAEVSRLVDAVGLVLAVSFSPADGELIAGGPAARRRYLDVVLSLSQPQYLGWLAAFKQALRQRNAALRRAQAEEARAFDRPLAQAAAALVAAREAWVASWRGRFGELCRALGEPGAVELSYRPAAGPGAGAGAAVEDWLEALGGSLDGDLARGSTGLGPHRDRLEVAVGGRDLRTYGSAGQQRTAAIALRMLEAESLRAARGCSPIALYDDVFAELDRGRQERLLGVIREVLPGQAIVAAPRESEVPRALLDRPRWRIAGGRIGC